MESQVQHSRWPAIARALVIGRKPKFTLVRIFVLVAAVVLTRQFLLLPIRIIGLSMLPTYQDHGVNLVNRLAYRSHEPQRGDVVAVRTSGESIMYMKRVIGLPGDRVAFHEGQAVVNGQPLDEPYVQYGCDWEMPTVTVEPDEIFVVGDNRSMPLNYHYFGRTQRQRIVGKIVLCKNLFASSVPSR